MSYRLLQPIIIVFVYLAASNTALATAKPENCGCKDKNLLTDISIPRSSKETRLSFLNKIFQELNVDLNSTIIDLSKDEVNFSNDLVFKGAKKVYSLSSPSKFQIDNSSSKNIYLVSKDFFSSRTIDNLLQQKDVSFIVGMNVLQNWSARQIDTELIRMYKGLKPGGSVLFNIKNPFINEQLTDKFFTKAYKNKSNILFNKNNISNIAMLNSSTTKLYRTIKKHYPNYELLPSSYFYKMKKRLVLYPFEMIKTASNGDKNYSRIFHLLFPKNMKVILERAGFNNVKIGKTEFLTNSFYISGIKS